MKNLSPPSSKDIYTLIRTNWHIKPNKINNLKIKLSEFGLSAADINLMLNSIEWKYNVKIGMETVPPQVTLDEFVKEVTSTAAPLGMKESQVVLDQSQKEIYERPRPV